MADPNSMFDEYFNGRSLGNTKPGGGGERLPYIEHGSYRLIVTKFETAKPENGGMITSLKFFVERAQAPRFTTARPHNAENSRCAVTWMWDAPSTGKYVAGNLAKFVVALFGLPALGCPNGVMPKFPEAMSSDEVRNEWKAFAARLDQRHKDLRAPENIARGMLIDCNTFQGKKTREAIAAGQTPAGDFVNLDFAHVAGQTPADIAARRKVLDEHGF
jgi:hypothetical protein